jgi:two-component system, response regulator PdtaR
MKNLRVVTADDDGLTLMVLKKILTAMGHEVIGEAGDGEQAVALVKEQKPDLCIFDIRMPKLNGMEAARQIQSHQPTPVIILSAHTESGLGTEAADVGAFAYLVKPFTAGQLKPAVEMALANFEKLRKVNDALETRKVVERAKGILMRQTGLDEEAAYLRLQKTARNENHKILDVARAIILAEQLRREPAVKGAAARGPQFRSR